MQFASDSGDDRGAIENSGLHSTGKYKIFWIRRVTKSTSLGEGDLDKTRPNSNTTREMSISLSQKAASAPSRTSKITDDTL